MKVLFLEDVPGTADAGEVKEVKNGFARNYLIPQKFAVQATANELQRIQSIHRLAQDKRQQLSNEARKVAKTLTGQVISVEMRVGPSGRLFGSVTSQRISEQLNQLLSQPLDHRNIILEAPIREPGDHSVTVRVYRKITSEITVRVVAEGYVPEDLAEEETDTPISESDSLIDSDSDSDSETDPDEPIEES
jgi:large subunit ribosomal protein L9